MKATTTIIESSIIPCDMPQLKNPTSFDEHILDTSAQIGKTSAKEQNYRELESIRKRAQRYVQQKALAEILMELVKGNRKKLKRYQTMYKCGMLIEQKGQRLTSRYCNNRLCSVCNSIRTAKLIEGYRKPLSELEDTYLVTVTMPNIKGQSLRRTIEDMVRTSGQIQDIHKKRGGIINGLRKIEITYNSEKDNYHPHFHLIIEGKKNSESYINEWLKRNIKATARAQDMRKCNADSLIEIFKYITKLNSSDGKIHTRALEIINHALYCKRIYQPLGKVRKVLVDENIEDLESDLYPELVTGKDAWRWSKNDWFSITTKEALSGYKPDDRILKSIEKIR